MNKWHISGFCIVAALTAIGTVLELSSARALQPERTAGTSTGQAPVDLGTAGGFAILAKSGIDTVPQSAVTGDMGVSPIDSTAITGFSLILDSSGTFATSTQVTGKVFAADYAPPTPANLTAAISDMETAFVDAAGRPNPDFTELGGGDISGLTLVPGLYKWGTGVLISTDVTLSGGPNDVWIFQIAGGITQASASSVLLTGGALPENIFWQTFGAVALDTAAHFEGIILSQTEITLGTGASINGSLLSQTAVTLDQSAVTALTLGDCTGDGVVDLTDFAEFVLCVGGPMQPPGAEDCSCADLDHDGDVDLGDFGIFQVRFATP